MVETVNPESLDTHTLRQAYALGIFPMGDDSGEISFYQPLDRALLPITGLHISRSLQKFLRKHAYRVSFDEDFEGTMRSCIRPVENWITEELIRVYVEAHREGWAHSCEVWDGSELVGGTYGVAIGEIFSAESMFHRRTNASKLALHSMVTRCREVGFKFFDAQVMNPHLKSLGAYEISQAVYEYHLRRGLNQRTIWDLRA